MSDSLEKSWSERPDSSPIPYHLYLAEKENLAGSFIGAIFYGMPGYAPVGLCPSVRLSDLLFRDCCYSLLPMYARIAGSNQPHTEGPEVRARGSRHSDVLVRDDIYRDNPLPSIRFLHR